ncbi:DBH-like monooxygenase protein 2 [Orchesella cincta]|uniref:DBH-like monooxygenase protein 2 n=1 Tax=Orchesella cincta TaxID=48709 RepID=A0A1D2N6I4_ORCCI|nr:DBH-like monooxygenase protein 2 [Orchesella cincta]
MLLQFSDSSNMSSWKFACKILVLHTIYSYCAGQSLNRNGAENPYSHFDKLDQDGRYMLDWIVNWEQRRITFNVTVQTLGYVLLGVTSRDTNDTLADVVIGGVTSGGETYFTDRHRLGNNGVPVVDSRQNWDLHSARENGTHTFLSFSRAFDTCDEQDHVINEYDTSLLIWAYGETDNLSELRNSNEGHYPVYLLDPNVTPKALKRSTFHTGAPTASELEALNLKVWTITTRTKLPADHTHYHCTMHQAPRLGRQHHIVGMNTRLESVQAIKHTHHLLLYRCTPPSNTSSAEFFGPHVNSSGQQCYFLSRPISAIPTQYCTEIKYGWAIGQRITFMPDDAGLPMGDSLDEYYNLQIHYDNPDQLNDIEYDIHIDIFYTEQLRPNQMGLITVGHHIPGSPSLLIPPNSPDHRIFGHCGSECTESILPPEGINVAAFVQHTHYSGRKIKVSHFRGNQELPWLANDNNFNATFQETRLLRRPINIRRGDRLMTSCEMDNTWINGTVVGGFSTRQEMCLVYLYYYNQLQDYSLCRSEIVSQQYMRQYLGVNNITWDNEQLDYAATSPAHLAGQTMTSISDNLVNWTPQLRNELQQDHQFLPQVNACSRSPFSSIGGGQVEGSQAVGSEITVEVSYPTGMVEYVPPSQDNCRNWDSGFGRNRGHGTGWSSKGRWKLKH